MLTYCATVEGLTDNADTPPTVPARGYLWQRRLDVSECPGGCCPHDGFMLTVGCPGDVPLAPPRERLAHLRACQLLPFNKIVAATGFDRQTISRLLFEIAAETSPGGPPWRLARRTAEDGWLDQVMADTPQQTRANAAGSTRGLSEIELLAALYADPKVRSVLEKHGVPMATLAGSALERFPRPQALTADLVSDLYVGCGLGLSHIGLLTGRTSGAAGGVLRAKGIQLRPVGQRSPFLRRWRRGDG